LPKARLRRRKLTKRAEHALQGGVNTFRSSSSTLIKASGTTPEEREQKNDKNAFSSLEQACKKGMATALVTASLWAAPAFLDQTGPSLSLFGMETTSSTVAMAKEMACGSGSCVNKDPDSLLRLGFPITNKEVGVCTVYRVVLD
jgi:hypothetical protein